MRHSAAGAGTSSWRSQTSESPDPARSADSAQNTRFQVLASRLRLLMACVVIPTSESRQTTGSVACTSGHGACAVVVAVRRGDCRPDRHAAGSRAGASAHTDLADRCRPSPVPTRRGADPGRDRHYRDARHSRRRLLPLTNWRRRARGCGRDAHYGTMDPSHVRTTVTSGDRGMAYVSYRIGHRVFWTRKPVRIPAGETVLTDGETEIRARCGNAVSECARSPCRTSSRGGRTGRAARRQLATGARDLAGRAAGSPYVPFLSRRRVTTPGAWTASALPVSFGTLSRFMPVRLDASSPGVLVYRWSSRFGHAEAAVGPPGGGESADGGGNPPGDAPSRTAIPPEEPDLPWQDPPGGSNPPAEPRSPARRRPTLPEDLSWATRRPPSNDDGPEDEIPSRAGTRPAGATGLGVAAAAVRRRRRAEVSARRGGNGRGDWIRTSDLSVPNRALYQAEPRPDRRVSVP